MTAYPDRAPVSVLLVDDDVDIRETIKEVLEDTGYSVATAANGADALDQLQRIRPELILLDLSMPVMNGQEFRKAQLQNPETANIPTVALSAADRIRERTAGMNMNEALAKPVSLSVLLETVRRYCTSGPN